MNSKFESALAYLDLQMREEARKAFEEIPPDDPDFIEAWSHRTTLSERNNRAEQRRLASAGLSMIRQGERNSNLIHETALCLFYAGNAQASYDLLARLQGVVRWSPVGQYGMATYAASLGKWEEAAWLVLLSISNGGDSHMFFDLDLLPLWEFAASSRLDIKTALALAHPDFEAELDKLAGRCQEIDPSLEKVMPKKFQPYLQYQLSLDFPVFSPSAPAELREEFEEWRRGILSMIEEPARAAIKNARRLVLHKQIHWAVQAAQRGDTYAARWHTQFALAERPDWLQEFSRKLSRLGLQEVMADLKTVLSRKGDFCKLLVEGQPVGRSCTESLLFEIEKYGAQTGYELIAKICYASREHDHRTKILSAYSLMKRWSSEPTGSLNLVQHFANAGNWEAANRILRMSPRSLFRIKNTADAAHKICENQKFDDFSLAIKHRFYGQPDLGGLVRYGDPRWVSMGQLRRLRDDSSVVPELLCGNLSKL